MAVSTIQGPPGHRNAPTFIEHQLQSAFVLYSTCVGRFLVVLGMECGMCVCPVHIIKRLMSLVRASGGSRAVFLVVADQNPYH